MKKSAQSSEWVLIGSLFIIMGALIVIAKVNACRAATTISAQDLQQEEILVAIDGAVAKPGKYKVPSGTPVEEVLRKARPKSHANTKILPLKQLIEAPMEIHVDELTEIAISVRGAAEPLELTLPAKSRICDLRSKVSLTAEADKSFFRRRRLLKDREVIEVPKKTVEVNSAH